MKNYIGISRDHSGSMASIARYAARDYNNNIASIKENSVKQNQDTIVSVVKCGVGQNGITREVINSSVSTLQVLNESKYGATGGSTPLFDSVGDLIEQFERCPDANDPTVSFLVMAITDGQDNASRKWKHTLGNKIAQLQSTDRWSFVFRVPRSQPYGSNYKLDLVRMGIPDGNILEWDQTEQGVEVATQATTQAFEQYFTGRTRGVTSTKNFYTTDLTQVSARKLKSALVEITDKVEFLDVTAADNGKQIRAFIEAKRGAVMGRGAAFYQLTKKEDEVQDHKQIAIRDKKTKKVFSGVEARNMLGLPHNGTVKVAPGNHGGFDIFIQSTSVNRKLLTGTQVMYWDSVGVAYQS